MNNVTQKTPHISIVSPVYRAEKIIEKLVIEIQATMDLLGCTYEIILVDDRSLDNTWSIMQKISENHKEVKSIRLSKNFGENPAIIAGLTHATGDWVVVMDCDLQDQPIEILKLYQKATEGFDIVLAKRKDRKDPFLKKLSSKIFSKIFGYLTGTKYDHSVNNYGIYHKKVTQSILQISDYIKFFPLFVNFVGYNSTTIDVRHACRTEGTSTYTLMKLLSLAFNVLISFSNKPLKIFVKFGLIISIMSIFIGFSTIMENIRGETPVVGYSSLMVSIWFLSGVNITIVGVVGIYVGKIFDQSKGRVPFIIDEILN